MSKNQKIEPLEQSLVAETVYVEIPQEIQDNKEAFETSIGVTQKIQLPNASMIRESEFQKDMKIYKDMYKDVGEKSMKKKKQPAPIQQAEDSVNEFLVVTKDSVFKPSKWSKPDKSQEIQDAELAKLQAANQLPLPMAESIKVVQPIIGVAVPMESKAGKWSKPEQKMKKSPQKTLKKSMRKSKLKKSKLVESKTVQPWNEGEQSAHSELNLESMQTSAVSATVQGSSNSKAESSIAAVSHMEGEEEEQDAQEGDEEDEEQDEQEDEDQEQEQQEEQEEQEDQEEEQEEQQEQEEEEDEEDEEEEEEQEQQQGQDQQQHNQDQQEEIEEPQLKAPQPITQDKIKQITTNKYEQSGSLAISNSEVPSKWKKKIAPQQSIKLSVKIDPVVQLTTEGVSASASQISNKQYHPEDYLASQKQEREWLQAQDVIKGLASLIN